MKTKMYLTSKDKRLHQRWELGEKGILNILLLYIQRNKPWKQNKHWDISTSTKVKSTAHQ
jgi:hypothetical protein